MKNPSLLLALAITAAAATPPVQADGSYNLRWSTIDGGGGTSFGGNYSLSGTIGQPDAGTLRGGNYALHGGFWGLFGLAQTPGAPTLRIARHGANGAVVAWPAPSIGWTLQQTSTVGPSAGWTDVNAPPVVVNGAENTITFPVTSGARYFRLRGP